MKKCLKNALLILLAGVAVFSPFAKWEVFADSHTLIQFSNVAFWLIIVFCAAALFAGIMGYADRKGIRTVLPVFAAMILCYLVYKAQSITGHLSDGTAVNVQKEYGYYADVILLAVYIIFSIIDVLKVPKTKK